MAAPTSLPRLNLKPANRNNSWPSDDAPELIDQDGCHYLHGGDGPAGGGTGGNGGSATTTGTGNAIAGNPGPHGAP